MKTVICKCIFVVDKLKHLNLNIVLLEYLYNLIDFLDRDKQVVCALEHQLVHSGDTQVSVHLLQKGSRAL